MASSRIFVLIVKESTHIAKHSASATNGAFALEFCSEQQASTSFLVLRTAMADPINH